MVLKRVFDIIFAATVLLLMLPVFAVATLMIKATSPGLVFYRGVRTGRFGRPFRIYKFRTMFVGCEKPEEDTTALNDPRITRVGDFLRKYKIDELPQLINVLKGEMSIVGPRPELPAYTDRYTPDERLILEVRPGITDMSSIMFSSLDERVGPSNPDKVFGEEILPVKNQLRLEYVHNISFWQDMKLIFLTFAAILSKAFRKKPADPEA